jgi:hypothetical protein
VAGKLAHLFGVDRGLHCKVEACEVAHEGEARELQSHLDAPFIRWPDIADDGLATFVNVDVLHRDLLLSLSAMTVQSLHL